ncbi:MAG: hypothetical protein ACLUKQ_05435 [Peptococcaceae bacterium]
MDQKRIREFENVISTDYGNTTGVVVLKEGNLVYEKYFKGCTRESQVHVYSVTKSIMECYNKSRANPRGKMIK